MLKITITKSEKKGKDCLQYEVLGEKGVRGERGKLENITMLR